MKACIIYSLFLTGREEYYVMLFAKFQLLLAIDSADHNPPTPISKWAI